MTPQDLKTPRRYRIAFGEQRRYEPERYRRAVFIHGWWFKPISVPMSRWKRMDKRVEVLR